MAVKLSPLFNDAQLDSSGNPYSGAQLFVYAAGSTTKQTAYQDSAGSTPHTNPIILNSRGEPPAPIWLTSGQTYKFVLATPTDTDPPAGSVRSVDNITGVNDTTVTIDQWVSGPAPTYVSATSFTLSGDQTSTFHVGRRLKTTNSGGTVYSTITASAYGALTTVTVVNDSGTLDAGLSAVSYGLVSAVSPATPPFGEIVYLTSVAGTNTITASASVAAAGLRAGQAFVFVPANTNTAATTLNVNSLGAKNVFCGGVACVGGEMIANVPCLVEYDGTQFNILGPTLGSESTFTPAVAFGGGTTGITYTTQLGRGKLIGKRFFFQLIIALSNKGSSTGSATITGFPHTSKNTAGLESQFASGFNNTATLNVNEFGVSIGANTTSASVFNTSGTSVSAATDAHFTNTTSISLSGHYLIE